MEPYFLSGIIDILIRQTFFRLDLGNLLLPEAPLVAGRRLVAAAAAVPSDPAIESWMRVGRAGRRDQQKTWPAGQVTAAEVGGGGWSLGKTRR